MTGEVSIWNWNMQQQSIRTFLIDTGISWLTDQYQYRQILPPTIVIDHRPPKSLSEHPYLKLQPVLHSQEYGKDEQLLFTSQKQKCSNYHLQLIYYCTTDVNITRNVFTQLDYLVIQL